jgi:hypothetical protein
MPHCNDADSGSDFAAARKGADFRRGGSRERLRKVLPQSARTDTGHPCRQVTALRTGNRKLSKSPYREVGGESFPSAGASRRLIAA